MAIAVVKNAHLVLNFECFSQGFVEFCDKQCQPGSWVPQ